MLDYRLLTKERDMRHVEKSSTIRRHVRSHPTATIVEYIEY
jgi:hypothetical protein